MNKIKLFLKGIRENLKKLTMELLSWLIFFSVLTLLFYVLKSLLKVIVC
jgi:hypothetical protein